ncbi:hypothetical protein MASR2M79_11430 [Aminivibrio sp.]
MKDTPSELKRMILRLGKLGEEAVTKAVWALKSRAVLAKSVLDNDDRLDNLAGRWTAPRMHFTARYQPLGEDLRTVTSIMHMAIDFERIGDYGCNIARVALSLAEKELIKPLIDIPRMVEVLAAMTENSFGFQRGRTGRQEGLPHGRPHGRSRKADHEELLLLMMERPQRIEQASAS